MSFMCIYIIYIYIYMYLGSERSDTFWEMFGLSSCSNSANSEITHVGQGSLKDTFCPFETWLFHQNKGNPPLTRQCSGV